MSGEYGSISGDRHLTGGWFQVYLEHIFYFRLRLEKPAPDKENRMHSGMLWYDDGRQGPLEDRLLRAVEYYRRKYGRTPTLCLVNPGTMDGTSARLGDVMVRAYGPMLPGHFWIGVEDQPTTRRLRANGHRKRQRVIGAV